MGTSLPVRYSLCRGGRLQVGEHGRQGELEVICSAVIHDELFRQVARCTHHICAGTGAHPCWNGRNLYREASPHVRRDWPLHIFAGTSPHLQCGAGPHLRRDSPTSAPGLAHICAGTRSHLRRAFVRRSAAG